MIQEKNGYIVQGLGLFRVLRKVTGRYEKSDNPREAREYIPGMTVYGFRIGESFALVLSYDSNPDILHISRYGFVGAIEVSDRNSSFTCITNMFTYEKTIEDSRTGKVLFSQAKREDTQDNIDYWITSVTNDQLSFADLYSLP